ncbi:MAG TPA: 8-amino-7-oxononanoate synthase [Solirubrobacteraceae bacterium]|nr:8-amino-7-oxononanoate synthase [Solirubrobacteraceae bacterium]
MSEISERLAALERAGLGRRMRLISGPQGPTVLLDGRPVLLLCSNNYLGLADHPRVREAAADAAMRWGVGAGASRLVSGTMTIHGRLEERLAAFERTQACLLFGSGYLANVGVLGALAGRGDVIFSDELNHASIVDGCRLSRAEVVVYRHLDVEHLHWCLVHNSGRRDRETRRVIVTDSVFSMDGDVAPLREIVELAQAADARVVVDEAHATGTLGPDGRGALAEEGLEGEVDVLVGTLGKALGSYGAYACADEEMVRYLINTARPFIFSTAPSPPAAAGALAAVELLLERPHRVERLHCNARALRRALASEGFAVADGEMHIVPLVVGPADDAVRLCAEAIEHGVFAQAIRPPTVAEGTSRLRLAAMASHTASDMRGAAAALGRAARAVGLDPASIGSPETPRLTLAASEDYDAFDAEFGEEFELAEIAAFDTRSSSRAAPSVFDGELEAAPAPPAVFDRALDVEIGRAGRAHEPERPAPFDIERDAGSAPDAWAA